MGSPLDPRYVEIRTSDFYHFIVHLKNWPFMKGKETDS